MPDEMSFPIRSIAKNTIVCESGNRLLEWGGKIFYFDRRKCIQFVNFASKLTIFVFDVKLDDLPRVGQSMAEYLMDIYADDKKTQKRLERLFKEHPVCAFSNLTDKSIIATLNHTQRSFADDGYRFYNFIDNNILQTRKINQKVNKDWLFSQTSNGKKEYYYAADKFKQLLAEMYD